MQSQVIPSPQVQTEISDTIDMAPILSRLADKYGLTFSAGVVAGGASAFSETWATGGIINDYEVSGTFYRAHIFTGSGTFEVTDSNLTEVEYLVVAGGGSGDNGSNSGGGGGAGGFRTNVPGTPHSTTAPFPISSPSSYTVTIGAGAAVNGITGGNSIFDFGGPNPITSNGGGGGGGSADPGSAGGSGGGGGTNADSTTYPGGASTSVTTPSPWPGPATQGNAGGSGLHIPGAWEGGGGGGGAGAAGENASQPDTTAGRGGKGIQLAIAGPAADTTGFGGLGHNNQYQWFAGGGGGQGNSSAPGGSWDGSASLGVGNYSGGGSGGGAEVNRSGAQGTGGGGGGAPPGGNAGRGGSGIVVVRYQIPGAAGTAKATGGSISYYNGKTIHTFTSSGIFATTSDWSATDIEYVIVGGGAAGGADAGGGGGAGAYRTGTTPIGAHPVATSIQVGAGGAGVVPGQPEPGGNGGAGTPSYFGTPLTSPGGGGGGGGLNASNNGAGSPGGSGGGGRTNRSPGAGGPATGSPFPGTIGTTPASGWGHPGGNATTSAPYVCGGGGGAGSAGLGNPPNTGPSAGGLGMQLPTTFRDPASSVGYPGPTSPTFTGADTSGKFWLAGGGGGGNNTARAYGGGGSSSSFAGAGTGGYPINEAKPPGASPGQANSGSGGGGQPDQPIRSTERGGSGIVIIAYPS